jgi:alpha-tubulin suppressor-like RCC1 family protein/methionine-rich copper-binding protein CopC
MKKYLYLLLIAFLAGCGVNYPIQEGVDTTPPAVVSTAPTNQGTGVAVNQAISIYFSEPVDGASVGDATFSITDGSGNSIAGVYATDGNTITFTPSDSLKQGTHYNVKVGPGIRDIAGNAMGDNYTWSFTTGGQPDTTAPTITSVTPSNGATNVPVGTLITATFSEPVLGSSVTADTFAVSLASTAVAGSISINGSTVTFTPTSPLEYGKIYSAKVTTGVRDQAGNSMSADYTWSFTTASQDQTDKTPPQVISVIPADGSTGIAVNTTITATFSEPVMASTFNTGTFWVTDGAGNGVPGTISVTDSTATYTPTSPLNYNTIYYVLIAMNIKDLNGNQLADSYAWSFTTATQGITDTTPPAVTTLYPANEATGVSLTASIVAVFSEAIKADTGTITVTKNGTPVGGSVSYNNDRIIFYYTGSLSPNTTYTVLVSGVQDMAGNVMAGSYTWSFTTQAQSLAIGVAGGNWHTVALKSDGTVKAWGNNQGGQLGTGDNVSTNEPVNVNGLSGIIEVSAGVYHTLALKNDGTVWVWGFNEYGLGDGTSTESTTPVQVSGLASIIAISSNGVGDHSLALKNDGTVWAWGRNTWGELGDGSATDRATPVQAYGLTNVTAIAAGGGHSLALKGDGTVWAWGNNQYGPLGQGTTWGTYYTPVQVPGLTGVAAIAAGGNHSLALKNDGTVWAWGGNTWGELGDGSATDRATPVQAYGLTNVTAIAAGGGHSLALKGDGTVWAWGNNQYGQLGVGSRPPNTISAPTQVITASGLTSAISIGIGRNHSFAVKGDGTLWAWGMNMNGQLGIGNNTSWTAPKQVTGF